MAKKIEGYVYSNNVPTEGGNRLSDTTVTFFPSEDPNPQMTHKAVLVIHDGPSERVWTESEVRAMRWIPVAEQLPEMVPDGIGWSKSEEVLAMYIDADIRYCKVAYCRTTPEGHIQWIGIKATHWMPLPEAP